MENLFIARQPVFGRREQVWGYELLYRTTWTAQAADISDPEMATLKVASFLSVSPDYKLQSAYNIINATAEFILQKYPRALASDKLVLSFSPDAYENAEIPQEIEILKQEGVKLAFTVNSPSPGRSAFFREAHIVEIPFPVFKEMDRQIWRFFQEENFLCLVNRIETRRDAQTALEAGADLLQGFYFQYPANYTLSLFPPSLVNRLQILQILESERQNIEELARAVELDVSLAYKLIRFVNSAAFSLVRKIDSVRHAIALVGWNRLKNWVHLMVVLDFSPTDRTRELAFCSAVRGKFLELLALYSRREDLADKLYLLGLFSLLDTILGRPFTEIFNHLSLSEEIENALLGKTGGLQPWLELAQVLDSDNWLQVDSYAMDLGLDLKTISKSKVEALQWANDFVPVV